MKIRLGQIAALLALLLLPILGAGGNDPPAILDLPRHYDFLAHFSQAAVQTPDPTYVRADEVFWVAGEGRFVLYEHPDSQVTFPDVEVHESGSLEFGIGIHQEAWERQGDGVRFIVEIVDEAGRLHEVYARHLDPHHRPEDRRWFDETVALHAFAGQRLQVIFRTEAGKNPQNDWAAWSNPFLVSWERRLGRMPKRPNILFVSIDTLRADHLSCYGYPLRTSPTLDRLAREGVLFANAYSQSERTKPSHATMFTGLYPRSHGMLSNYDRLPLEIVTIGEILQEEGYHTVGMVSGAHMGPSCDMDQGFADFYACLEDRRLGGKTTDIALEWLIEQGQEPFFMWVHYFDVHAEYLPPHPYDLLYDASRVPYHKPMSELRQPADWTKRYADWTSSAEDVAEIIAQYDGSVAYNDAQVARLLAYLEESDLADRTVVIVTSDHGEGFGEHGVCFDHYGVHEEMVHVPLIMRFPGGMPAGWVVQDFVGLIDLTPTILDLLGLPTPGEMQGMSLLPLLRGNSWQGHEGIVSEAHSDSALTVRTPSWRLILQQQDDDYWPLYPLQVGQVELYDLRTDPAEANNLWPTTAGAAQDAQRTLFSLLRRWEEDTPYAIAGEGAPLDKETEELLRRLGY